MQGPCGYTFRTQLLHQAHKVLDGPVFYDLAVTDAPDGDPRVGDGLPGRRKPLKLFLVGAGERPALHYFVPLADQLLDVAAKVGEGAKERTDKAFVVL